MAAQQGARRAQGLGECPATRTCGVRHVAVGTAHVTHGMHARWLLSYAHAAPTVSLSVPVSGGAGPGCAGVPPVRPLWHVAIGTWAHDMEVMVPQAGSAWPFLLRCWAASNTGSSARPFSAPRGAHPGAHNTSLPPACEPGLSPLTPHGPPTRLVATRGCLAPCWRRPSHRGSSRWVGGGGGGGGREVSTRGVARLGGSLRVEAHRGGWEEEGEGFRKGGPSGLIAWVGGVGRRVGTFEVGARHQATGWQGWAA